MMALLQNSSNVASHNSNNVASHNSNDVAPHNSNDVKPHNRNDVVSQVAYIYVLHYGCHFKYEDSTNN